MVIAIVAVPGTGYLYFQDLNTYSKQKAEVERKKDRIRKDVDQLKFQVSTINQEISKSVKRSDRSKNSGQYHLKGNPLTGNLPNRSQTRTIFPPA